MAVPPALLPYRRTAWLPVTDAADGPRDASKLAGTAWTSDDAPWPTCPNCGRPLQLLLQLDPADLPDGAPEVGAEGGLLQLFYCTSQDPLCEVDREAFLPFSDSVVARRVVPDGEPAAPPALAAPFPPRQIVGWEPLDDLPTPEDAPDAALTEAEWDEVYATGHVERDKLGGWPLWIQGPERPDCPRCGRTMEVVFQLVSEDQLPIVFGDMGTGHLTQCPEHRDVLAFGWACT